MLRHCETHSFAAASSGDVARRFFVLMGLGSDVERVGVSSTATLRKSRAISSREIEGSGGKPEGFSSAISDPSSYVVTVCPFARPIGKFSSAWAGRGGDGWSAFRFPSRT